MKNFLNLPMHTARIPPVDPAPATITAVLAMQAGHIYPSSELLIRSRRLAHSGIHPLRASPQGLLKPGPTDTAVGAGDQNGLICNAHTILLC